MDRLKHQKNDVKAKLDMAEVQQMKPKEEVLFWIQSIETMEGQVNEMIEECNQQISNRCLCGCCPKNCWSNYKVGKRVAGKLTAAEGLRSTGNFSDVAVKLPPPDVEAMPSRLTVGMDLIFENVWKCIREEDQVRMMGLYGMGGVGKTTIMKKINNKMLSQKSPDFDVVIWIVVSKETSTRSVQKDIADRLGLLIPEDGSDHYRASIIFKNLMNKKFVLMLDDIWDRVDFEAVGIPFPNSENKSKVIFTTRSEALCGRMEAHKKIKVDCLDWDDAWDLFQMMVGEEAFKSHPQIPKLAEVVARECAGLPLALIAIGRTMASKKTPHEWNHAITVLRKAASEFSGMGDEVLPLLKFSYDSLPNHRIQSCFLYCSLYPEDYNIEKEELIEHWVGEGFITEFDDMNEARYQGHDIIGTLKLACLLESGNNEDLEVKMHDVIRDLALWIASEYGRKMDKFLVQASVGLNEAPDVEKWKKTERISLMHNKIRKLTESPMCPKLLTLLLNGNQDLVGISDGFFKSMTRLRVLDLSWTKIREFPMEIVKLIELQDLNLSFTQIETVPEELNTLVKLKYLNLRCIDNLTAIPLKVISRLPRLQVLNLYNVTFVNRKEGWEGFWGGASLGELECLKHLEVLGITIRTVLDLLWFLNSHKLSRCANNLCIEEGQGSTAFPLLSSSSSTTLGNMKCLSDLCFSRGLDCEELTVSWTVAGEGKNGFFSSEKLILINMPNLKTVRVVSYQSSEFQNLSSIQIVKCDALKDITWLLAARSLQTLSLILCKGIEDVICGGGKVVKEESITFSKLKEIELQELPRLKSIYWHALPFPSLERIEIRGCPKLKKLPLDSNSTKKILKKLPLDSNSTKTILKKLPLDSNNPKRSLKWFRGEKQWWDELEWEDESAKNDCVFNGVSPDPNKTCSRTDNLASELLSIPKLRSNWLQLVQDRQSNSIGRPLECEWTRIQVDGAALPSRSASVVGMVALDSEGHLLCGLIKPLFGGSARTVEADAIWFGMTVVVEKQWKFVRIKSDAKEVVEYLNEMTRIFHGGIQTILEDILTLKDQCQEVSFHFISCSDNWEAHHLAQRALRISIDQSTRCRLYDFDSQALGDNITPSVVDVILLINPNTSSTKKKSPIIINLLH
ncbi:hypothetical protein HHK36_022222 [Tetracentron sinense]|uniref:Uncharacterized protein n=1 Tax=Tetracentron sinense TaxID=13715 RepID=A0A834YU46_TETSI|nr:hypothetical protein HHK36_022222 [Tetracentron sinense]